MESSPQSLVVASGNKSLDLIRTSSIFRSKIQFWQTWANLEIAGFLFSSEFIPHRLKEKACVKATEQWVKYGDDDQFPSHFVAKNFLSNRNFWNPGEAVVIWDDRLWLGNSYVYLYKVFKVQKYLRTAVRIYDFVVENNWKVHNYELLEWAPKSNYLNTITNSLFMVLCGRLYETTGDQKYLDSLLKMYKLLFSQENQFIRKVQVGVFPDYFDGGGFYTYNQGVPLQGLLYLIVYQSNNTQYIQNAINLINNTVLYFRSKGTNKYLCAQFSEGKHNDLRTGSIFRSILFRTYCYMKRILKPNIFGYIMSKTPILRIFVLDNAQAMCKFQNLSPSYKWEFYDDHMIHEYNSFNQFYVLLAAHQLYNIQELVIDGIACHFNGCFVLDFNGLFVKQCTIFPAVLHTIDDKFFYGKGAPKVANAGQYRFEELIGQNLTQKDNNTTYFQIQIEYLDGTLASCVVVHMETYASTFGVIPNHTLQQIANNFVCRISVGKKEGISYCSSLNKMVSLTSSKHRTPYPLKLAFHQS